MNNRVLMYFVTGIVLITLSIFLTRWWFGVVANINLPNWIESFCG